MQENYGFNHRFRFQYNKKKKLLNFKVVLGVEKCDRTLHDKKLISGLPQVTQDHINSCFEHANKSV